MTDCDQAQISSSSFKIPLMAWHQCTETIKYRVLLYKFVFNLSLFPHPFFLTIFLASLIFSQNFLEFRLQTFNVMKRFIASMCQTNLLSSDFIICLLFFVLVLFFLIPDGEGNSSWTSSVPGKSSPGHNRLHWPANYVSDANGPSPASICPNTCWSANNNTRWPAHSVFLCPSWPNHATARKSGLYIDYFYDCGRVGWPNQFLWR